jgi:hypothetical protein
MARVDPLEVHGVPTVIDPARHALLDYGVIAATDWPAPAAACGSGRVWLGTRYILPACALLAPCRAGASTPKLTAVIRTGP